MSTIQIRKSSERGHANHGWLDTYHTFSFADYHDPEHMGFSDLRVINEDFVEAGAGFATHSHRDMEIITYVIEGALEHKDSMGNSTVIKPGEVQRMSAGTGVQHSEFNHFKDRRTHLLQIWVLPNKKNIQPGYEQKSFESELKEKKFILVASESGKDGSVSLHQDVNLYVGKSSAAQEIDFKIEAERTAWIQVVKGSVKIDSNTLSAGDGAAFTDSENILIKAAPDTEFLAFDLLPL
ncbi:MAG: pirin family protein [Deltaproteobacteria bacterium]|nr:pirin family protein [Deltaproteobacteria bacterium]